MKTKKDQNICDSSSFFILWIFYFFILVILDANNLFYVYATLWHEIVIDGCFVNHYCLVLLASSTLLNLFP